MTTLAVSVLAAWGMATLRGRARWLLAPLLALFAFEVLPVPLEPPYSSRLQPDEVVERLATLPPGAVHEVAESYYHRMGRQTLHQRPMPGGYVSREPTSRNEQQYFLVDARAQKRFAELMRRLKVRYLVLPNDEVDETTRNELAALHVGAQATIFVLPGDPLAQGDGARTQIVSCTDVGKAGVDVDIDVPDVAGMPYVLAFSRTRGEGIPYGRAGTVRLAPDDLMQASLELADPRFRGTHGRVPADGRVRAKVRLEDVWSGHALFFALVVFEDDARTIPARIVATGSWQVP